MTHYSNFLVVFLFLFLIGASAQDSTTANSTDNKAANQFFSLRINFFLEHLNDFKTIIPNTDPEHIRFQTVAFKPIFFDLDSAYYSGFRFKAPPDSGLLIWAFSIDNMTEWYIIPSDGKPQPGFTHFYVKRFNGNIPGIINRGDYFVLQDLPPNHLTPGKEYFIWIKLRENRLTKLAISFNIFENFDLNVLEVFDRYLLKEE